MADALRTTARRLAVVFVFAVVLRQRARRAWRAVWWALAGWLTPRWRCQLCQERRRRGSHAFCVRCCDAGLGYADPNDGADVEAST